MKKWIKWIVLAVVVVLFGGVGILWLNINRIVRATVQTQGTNQLGVQTTLGKANVSLWNGKVSLTNLDIANPQGFSSEHLFELGGVSVGTSLGQLRSDPVHIHTISISKPKLVIEQSGGKLNIKALMDQMPKSDQPQQPQQPKSEGAPLKLVIDDLSVKHADVVIRPGLPGIEQEYKLSVPSVDLKNIGKGDGANNGAALKDVVMDVVTAIANKAADSDKLPPEVRQLMKLNVSQLASQLEGQVKDQVSKAVADITANPANADEAAKNLQKGLEGGFKGILPGQGDSKKDSKDNTKKSDGKTSSSNGAGSKKPTTKASGASAGTKPSASAAH